MRLRPRSALLSVALGVAVSFGIRVAVSFALPVALGGCAYSVKSSSSGTQTGFGGGGGGLGGVGDAGAPPAQAPRGGPPAVPHGARFSHPSGVDLVWDAGLGLYVVPERPGTYFDGHFFYPRADPARGSGSGWAVARGPDGPWQPVQAVHLPPALRGR